MPGIFYHPEAYSITGPKLMGRNAAGDSFLRGYLKYAISTDSFFAQVSAQSHASQIREIVQKNGRFSRTKTIFSHDLNLAEDAGVMYHPVPGIGDHCRQRSFWNDDKWAICGITHTTSSSRAMDAIADLVTAPVQPWDSVICTSTAVKKNVEVVLQAQVDYLQSRLGITRFVMPRLPVIPLGINTSDFKFLDTQRSSSRAKIGVKDGDLVVLYTGRLSFHAKAHPLAMYQALEAAALASGKKIILIECGWHANEHIDKAFAAGAELACPSVKVITLDGRHAENRDTAWASADIFCSLSDNIQETFGIVPIEAMAAGLPVVVADWDGYKDTVRDGVDGFRIPTLAPAPGLAGDMALRHALEIDTYDMYCGHSSSLVAIHAQKLTQAFIELFQSPGLRKKMGESGRLRATQDYDWRAIIPRYEELWEEQTKIRLAAKRAREDGAKSSDKPLAPSGWPARLDPTIGFANYPTQHLTLATKLTLTESSADEAMLKLGLYKELAMVNYAHFIFPTNDEVMAVFRVAEENYPDSCSAEELIIGAIPQRRPYVLRGLGWLCKLGLLQFS